MSRRPNPARETPSKQDDENKVGKKTQWISEARACFASNDLGILLDVGCGGGESMMPFADQVQMAVGLDRVYAAVRAAREECVKQGIDNARFVVADAQALPIKRGSIDGLVSKFALHHTTMQVSLAEIRRVLRPDGKLYVLDLVNERPWERSLTGYMAHVITGIAGNLLKGRFKAAAGFAKKWLTPSHVRHMLIENRKLNSLAFSTVCENLLPGARIEEMGKNRRSVRWAAPNETPAPLGG